MTNFATTNKTNPTSADFDDQNPRFLDDKYTLVMDEAQSNLVGQNLLVLPRNLRAEDGDRGIMAPIVYSFDSQSSSTFAASNGLSTDASASGAHSARQFDEGDDSSSSSASSTSTFAIESYLHLNPTTGELRLIRQWPPGVAPLTLVVRATQEDNRDRYALTTLTIARGPSGTGSVGPTSGAGAADGAGADQSAKRTHKQLASLGDGDKLAARGIAFVQGRVSIQVPEDTPVNERILRVRAQHLAPDQQHQWGAPSSVSGPDSSNASQAAPSAVADNQQVDLIGDQLQASSSNLNADLALKARDRSRSAANNQDQQLKSQASVRPINYQILDDQTNQFGINGLGEIFLRRSLDYEQRQEFKFRVLATFTKHSDICHVQVSVINVNDNKPKVSCASFLL